MLEGRDVSGAGEALTAPGLWVKRYGTRALTATVQKWVEFPKSVRGCGLPLGPTVGVHYSPRRPVIRGVRQCRNRFRLSGLFLVLPGCVGGTVEGDSGRTGLQQLRAGVCGLVGGGHAW